MAELETSICHCEWERECVFESSGTLYYMLVRQETCMECCPPRVSTQSVLIKTIYTRRIGGYWRTKQRWTGYPGSVTGIGECGCVLYEEDIPPNPCEKYRSW